MFWRKKKAQPAFPTNQQLLEQLNSQAEAHNKLVRAVGLLREDVDNDRARFETFRAKTYGRLTERPGGRERAQDGETKDEFRARMRAEGKLKPN